MRLPVQYYVTSSFDGHRNRRPPSVNPGTDYGAPIGTPIYAPVAGTINNVYKGTGAAGWFIILDHATGGGNSDFLHLSNFSVSKGQKVTEGQLLGYTGATAYGKPNGVGPHLHWSFRPSRRGTLNNAGNADGDAYAIQSLLNKWAVYDKASLLVVDGVRGNATNARIRDFQSKRKITVDGIVGNATRAHLLANPPSTPTPPQPIITTKEEAAKETIVFETERYETDVYPIGVEEVTTAGVDGYKEIVWIVTYTDGIETSREVKEEKIVEPTTERIAVGTKPQPPSPEEPWWVKLIKIIINWLKGNKVQ